MRATVTINNIQFGKGMPKICLPEIETNEDDILSVVKDFETYDGWDVLEVRLDFFDGLRKAETVKKLLRNIKEVTDRIVLCTIRTSPEGGTISLTDEEYLTLLKAVVDSGSVQMIDVELSKGDTICKTLLAYAHKYGVKVVLSKHDFEKTPEKGVMESVLRHMDQLDGDFLKLAVMPENKLDVINLLKVTEEMSEELKHPLITISMGDLGEVSRFSGEAYGSVMTFATAGKASAPGQVPLHKMIEMLKGLHNTHD